MEYNNDLNQMKADKRALEQKIAAMLKEFSDKYGVTVDSISSRNVIDITPVPLRYLVRIDLRIE
jgi:flagellar biosynthesis component FlhA